MPTEEIVNIRPSGGDFTSVSDFIANYAGGRDLVTRDVFLSVRIWDEFTGGLSDSPRFSNGALFTTNESCHICIEANPGDECTYDLTAGARIKNASSVNPTLHCQTAHVIVKNVTLMNEHATSTMWTCYKPSRVINSLIYKTSPNGKPLGMDSVTSYSADGVGNLVKTVVARGTHDADTMFYFAGDGPFRAISSVFMGGKADLGSKFEGDAEAWSDDCVYYNTAGDPWEISDGTKPVTADNNAFSDATGTGTNKQLSIGTDQFSNYAGGIFTTALGSTMATNGIGILTDTPNLVIDQANLTPGGTISGSYSDYGSTPTSPLVLTDSNGNSINVSVTVTPTDSSSGSFTGTMPTLPTSGNSASFLLFGTITVSLT